MIPSCNFTIINDYDNSIIYEYGNNILCDLESYNTR